MLADGYYQLSPYNFVGNNPANYKDPDGKIITDANGNIIVVNTGKTTTVDPIQVTNLTQNADGTKSAIFLSRTYDIVNIFADNGTPIQALRLTGETQIKVTFDKDGKFVGSTDSAVDHGIYGAESDCHGFTFAGGKLWINDDQVESILINDDYDRDVEEDYSDIAVFKKEGGVVHSARRNSNSSYDNDAGVLKTERNVSLGAASRGLTNVDKKGNVEFAKKNQPNRTITTSLGTVGKDGTRTISDKNEIAKFMEQFK